MKLQKEKLALLLCFSAYFTGNSVEAQTALSGPITTSQVWSNVVTLSGDVTIRANGSVTILPGTIIKSPARSDSQVGGADPSRVELIVEGGRLTAVGAIDAPILFTADISNPVPGDWGAVRFLSGAINLKHVVVEYGRGGLTFEGGGEVAVSDSFFIRNSEHGLLVTSSGSFDLSNCTFGGNTQNGLYATGNGVRLNLTRCSFLANGQYGAYLVTGSTTLTLLNCQALNNGVNGVFSWGSVRAEDSEFNQNRGGGLQCQSLAMIRCNALGNQSGGIQCAKGQITGGTISDNLGWGVIYWLPLEPTDFVFLEMNNVLLERNRMGAVANGRGSFRLENSLVRFNGGPGILGGSGSATVLNSIIHSNAQAGVEGADGSISVQNCTISNNGGGVRGATLSAIGNVFISNAEYGIYLTDSVASGGILNNLIKGSGSGIKLETSKVINFSGNDLIDNGIALENRGAGAVTANGNFWGEPTTTELRNAVVNLTKIYDRRDSTAVGAVTISSYLEAAQNWRPQIVAARPFPGSSSQSDLPFIEAVLQDGGSSKVASVSLRLDGNPVAAVVERVGTNTTVRFTPATPLAPGSFHTVTLQHTDDASIPFTQTNQWTFRVSFTPFRTNTLFIEAEDFNFGKGGWVTNKAIGMNGPYLGGDYAGLGNGVGSTSCSGTDNGIDWFDPNSTHENGATSAYRLGTGVEIAKPIPSEGVNRGSFDVQVNHMLGWVDVGEWYNYTRQFPEPAQKYKVYARMASGGWVRQARLDRVTSNPALCNQTLEKLGTFASPATGGSDTWPDLGSPHDALVPLRDESGAIISPILSGKVTLRFTVLPGNIDFDYLAFIPDGPAFTGPLITLHPQSQTVAAGQSVTLAVAATGTAPIQYQWQKDGINLTGATTATYSIGSVRTNDAGAYTVVVWNASLTNVSELARLEVLLPPSIVEQPKDAAVRLGENAVFTVGALGSELSFQWRRDNEPLSGQNSRTLILSNVTASLAGRYNVVITNRVGNVTSSNATLILLPPAPVITAQPTNVTVLVGASATFSVAAEGQAPIEYQWRRDGATLAGQTAATLTLNSVSTNDQGAYSVVVSNPGGSVVSSNAVLTVALPPDPRHPADNNPADNILKLAEVVSYASSWKRGAEWPIGPNPIPISYMVRGGALWKGGERYRYDSTIATAPQYWVNITAAPQSFRLARMAAVNKAVSELPATYTPGTPFTVTITVTPVASVFAYAVEDQPPSGWVVSAINQGGVFDAVNRKVKWGLFTDSTARTLTYVVTPPASATGIATFTGSANFDGVEDVVISGGRQTSPPVIEPPPTITSGPTNLTVNSGGTATFSVVAAGAAPIKYQWQFAGVDIPGATNATLVLSQVVTNQSGQYKVFVSNLGGSVEAAAALLVNPSVVILPPQITSGPANLTVDAGATAVFNVTATGSAPLVFQWQFNGIRLPGESSATLTLSQVTTNQAGLYSVVVTNGAGAATNSATLTVRPPIQADVSTAISAMPANYTPGVAFTVTIDVSPASGVSAYAVEDAPPAGWSASNISDGGVLDTVNKKVKWGLFTDNTRRLLKYDITPAQNAAGSQTFRGTANFDGVLDVPISGVRVTSNTNEPPSLALDFYAGVALRGAVGTRFEIQFTDNLQQGAWQPLTNVVLTASPSLFFDIGSTNAAKRYYRAVSPAQTTGAVP